MTPIKSPILYFGGKGALGPAIAALLPEHQHYVEPYCGSLAVLLAAAGDPSRRTGTKRYVHEMLDPDVHRELAEALRSCSAAVVVSGYPSSLYDEELYPDWSRTAFAASTGQGGTWENRTEVLWSNRPIGEPHLFSEVTG